MPYGTGPTAIGEFLQGLDANGGPLSTLTDALKQRWQAKRQQALFDQQSDLVDQREKAQQTFWDAKDAQKKAEDHASLLQLVKLNPEAFDRLPKVPTPLLNAGDPDVGGMNLQTGLAQVSQFGQNTRQGTRLTEQDARQQEISDRMQHHDNLTQLHKELYQYAPGTEKAIRQQLAAEQNSGLYGKRTRADWRQRELDLRTGANVYDNPTPGVDEHDYNQDALAESVAIKHQRDQDAAAAAAEKAGMVTTATRAAKRLPDDDLVAIGQEAQAKGLVMKGFDELGQPKWGLPDFKKENADRADRAQVDKEMKVIADEMHKTRKAASWDAWSKSGVNTPPPAVPPPTRQEVEAEHAKRYGTRAAGTGPAAGATPPQPAAQSRVVEGPQHAAIKAQYQGGALPYEQAIEMLRGLKPGE